MPTSVIPRRIRARQPGALAAPTSLAVSAAMPNAIDLGWSHAGADHYTVERSANGSTGWATIGHSQSNRYIDYGETGVDATYGLAASTTYHYRVTATAGGVSSSPSSALSAATASGTASKPALSTAFSAVAQSPTTAYAQWDASGDATGYIVSRAPDVAGSPGTYTQIGFPATKPASGSPFTDPTLTPGASYWYSLRPFKSTGVGDVGIDIDCRNTTAKVAGALPASHGLMAVPHSSTRVDLSWLAVSQATGYTVERSADGSTGWTQVYSGTAAKFGDTGLSASTAYHYRFRATNAWGIAGTSSPSDVVQAITHPAAGGRRLLRKEDFTYLGSFMPPFFLDPPTNSITPAFGKGGIAARRVGGVQRFFGLTGDLSSQQLFEFTPPSDANLWDGVSTLTTASHGTLVRLWGDPYNGKKLFYVTGQSTAAGSTKLADESAATGEYESHGLSWDAATNSVYISTGQYYNVTLYNHPGLLRATLDDATHAITTAGPWRSKSAGDAAPGKPNNTMIQGGSTPIPQWFADANLSASGGRRLGVGFGGEYSGSTVNSFGPALFALDTAALTSGNACVAGQTGTPAVDPNSAVADASLAAPKVDATCLVSHYFGDNHYARRPPGYDTTRVAPGRDQGSATGGYGIWTETDRIYGGGCWIDDDAGTRGKHGFVAASWFGFGQMGYKPIDVYSGTGNTGGQGCDGGIACGLAVYDPAALATTAAGGSPSAPLPSPPSWWIADFPGADGRTAAYVGRFAAPATSFITGMAFDATANRLYLHQADAVVRPGGSASCPLIHVYSVAN